MRFVEIGAGQAGSVADDGATHAATGVHRYRDFAGIERVIQLATDQPQK